MDLTLNPLPVSRWSRMLKFGIQISNCVFTKENLENSAFLQLKYFPINHNIKIKITSSARGICRNLSQWMQNVYILHYVLITNYLQNDPLRRIMSLANEDPSFGDGLF